MDQCRQRRRQSWHYCSVAVFALLIGFSELHAQNPTIVNPTNRLAVYPPTRRTGNVVIGIDTNNALVNQVLSFTGTRIDWTNITSIGIGGGDVFQASNNTFVVGKTNTFNGDVIISSNGFTVRNSITTTNNLGLLFDHEGNKVMDWRIQRLYSPLGSISDGVYDWKNNRLFDLLGQNSIFMNTRQMLDANGNVTVNWDSGSLFGSAANHSWTSHGNFHIISNTIISSLNAAVRINTNAVYTNDFLDYFVAHQAAATVITNVLPMATNTGRILILKKSDSTLNDIVIVGAGTDKIDGFASYTLSIQNQSVNVIANQTNWFIH